MRRVLLATFEGLVIAGLRDLLQDAPIVLLERRTEELMLDMVDQLPDVVILDRDHGINHGLVVSIQSQFPAVKVLDCSPENSSMRIYPAFHCAEYYDCPLDSVHLRRAVLS